VTATRTPRRDRSRLRSQWRRQQPRYRLLGPAQQRAARRRHGDGDHYWGSNAVFGPSTAEGYHDTAQTLAVPATSLQQIVSGGWACFRYSDGSVQCFGPGLDEAP